MPLGTASHHYLNAIKTRLATSTVVVSTTIVAEYALTDYGYIRARLTLRNGDFLEVSEFFTVQEDDCITTEYRYQWMDATRQHLIQRWDNAAHFPDLPNAPYHVHVEQEDNVVPGQRLSILELIAWLEQEL